MLGLVGDPAYHTHVRITRVFAHRVELPLHEGRYAWSGGKFVDVFDSTIVGIETDIGSIGYGEVCPLGPFYLPAYADGVRAGLRELAPHVIGLDPQQLGVLNARMDAALKGHPYVKAGTGFQFYGNADNRAYIYALPYEPAAEAPDKECRIVRAEADSLQTALEEMEDGEIVVFFYEKNTEPSLGVLRRFGAVPVADLELEPVPHEEPQHAGI